VHHLALPRYPVATQLEEVLGSRIRIEALVGRRVRVFAYPFGEHDERCARFVQAAGFAGAVTVESGAAEASTDPCRIPRLEVTPDLCPAALEARIEALLAG
jgi:peptidoglycan/xylan/chitin deacetylase (PgdA/CDA1 family)